MACGGEFYLLSESDIIIAAESATFFDPHVTYAMTAVYEPILLRNRMAFGDLVRMSLAGIHERISARLPERQGWSARLSPPRSCKWQAKDWRRSSQDNRRRVFKQRCGPFGLRGALHPNKL
jgi:hypothetical protein